MIQFIIPLWEAGEGSWSLHYIGFWYIDMNEKEREHARQTMGQKGVQVGLR